MMNKLILLMCLAIFQLQAQQESVTKAAITSFASQEGKSTIAILPFTTTGTETFSKESPWSVVADDFDFSGRFTLFKKKSYDKTDFALSKILLYVGGEYETKGDSCHITFHLFDAVTTEEIFTKKYVVGVKKVTSVAHDFSNQAFMELFGEKGGFETRILYVKKGESGKNVYIADYNGDNARALTQTGINIMPTFESFSSVLFVSYLRGKPDIYRTSTNKQEQIPLIYSRGVDVSPDVYQPSGEIVYSSSRNGNMDIYYARRDGSNKIQLTSSPTIDAAPAWSPSGYNVAFISDRSGSPQLYVMDKYGGNQKRLTFNTRYVDSPCWSPDGTQIAYTAMIDGQYRIGIINADGSDERVQTAEVGGSHQYPAWSPTGKHIAFARSGGGYSDIFSISIEDKRVRRLTNVGSADYVSWSNFRE